MKEQDETIHNPASELETLYERIQDYGKSTFELSKLKLLQTTISLVTAIVARLSVVIVMSLFVLVFNIGVALFVGEWLGKLYWGFFVVSGCYLVVGILFHFFIHGWIKRAMSTMIIHQAFKDGK